MKMPFEDASFDAVYEIDATCHAPDQVGCYKVRKHKATGRLQWQGPMPWNACSTAKLYVLNL